METVSLGTAQWTTMPHQPFDESRPTLRSGRAPKGGSSQYEYRVVTFPSRTSRTEATQLLTEEAEYGRWELARTVVYFGGARKIWLRRRIQRVQRSV